MLESGASERAIVELLQSRGWTEGEALEALSSIEEEKKKSPHAPPHLEESKRVSHAPPPVLEPRSVLQERGDQGTTRREVEKTPRVGSDTPSRLPGPLALTSLALSLMRERRIGFVALSFIAASLYSALYVFGTYLFAHESVSRLWEGVVAADLARVTSLPLLALALLFAGMIISGILSWFPASLILALSERATTTGKAFREGWKGGLRFFFSFLVYSLLVVGGLILFIVPGLIVGVWGVFAPLIAVRERTTPLQAFLISREFVRGHFSSIVGRWLFLVIPTAFFVFVLYLLFRLLFVLTSPDLGVSPVLFLGTAFAVPLLFCAFLLFVCAYQTALYDVLRSRITTVTISKNLARLLPLLLVIPLAVSLVVAFVAVVSASV